MVGNIREVEESSQAQNEDIYSTSIAEFQQLNQRLNLTEGSKVQALDADDPHAAPLKPRWTAGSFRIFWVAGPIAIYGLFNYLFALAGIRTFPWTLFAVQTVADPAKGNVIAAAVALVGGAIGLATFCVNYHQKIYLQELQNHKDREIARRNRGKQNEWELRKVQLQERQETERQRLQQEHFNRQRDQERAQADFDAIAAEYDALSKDFASSQELSRINAAIGLASIAVKPNPIVLLERQANFDVPKDSRHFPWFERVATQLASAIHIYDETTTREQVKISIQKLAQFDVSSVPQQFLHNLIDRLADANRTSYRSLVEVLAKSMAQNSDQVETFSKALVLFNATQNFQFIKEIEKKHQQEFIFAKEKLQFSNSLELEVSLLERIRVCSEKLLDIRDMIAYCTSKAIRTTTFEFPEHKILNVKPGKDLEVWKAISELRSGVDTKSKADLSNCFMEGAMLSGNNLSMLNLEFANFSKCDLTKTDFRGSVAKCTNFNEANFYMTNFDFSILSQSKLNGFLGDVFFRFSDLSYCDFSSATFLAGEFWCARMWGSSFPDPRTKKDNFLVFSWRDADWTSRAFASEYPKISDNEIHPSLALFEEYLSD